MGLRLPRLDVASRLKSPQQAQPHPANASTQQVYPR
jgi:hypothetical protein